MEYLELKTFLKYCVRPQANYQFVMIKTLAIVEHATRDSIAKDLQEANPNIQTDFRRVPVYEVLVNKGIVKESSGMFSLIDYDKLSADQKKMLVKICNEKIVEYDENKKLATRKYWKVAPGKQAEEWDFQKSAGVIGIGWNDLGDLFGKSIQEAENLINKVYPDSITASQFRNYLSIKPGDVIIANRGKNVIVGIGEVKGNYKFEPNYPHSHTFPVDWFFTKEKEIPNQNDWGMTVRPVYGETFCSFILGTDMDIVEEARIPIKLEENIKEFDKNKTYFNEDWKISDDIDSEREAFVSKFPIEKIPDMTLNEYVVGKEDPTTKETNRTTFCYLLENSLDSFGSIWGSPAQKFGIFSRKASDKYYFDEEKYNSVEEAFSALKHELVTILEAGQAFQKTGDISKLSEIIDDGDFQIQRHIISKILAVYYPDVFLCIHSNTAINTLLDYFKIARKEIDDKLQIKKYKIFQIKNHHPLMKNWSSPDYSYFLWKSIVKPIKGKTTKSYTIIITNGSSSPECAKTNSCLSENKVFIDIGDTVIWQNNDDALHTITSGTPEDGHDGNFDSGAMESKSIFKHTFSKPATYSYYDAIHPWITGEIIVGKEIITEEIKDSPLKLPDKEKLRKGVETITKDLLIDPKVIEEIVINLASGRHILLAGPIGTGKTQLAIRIPKIFWADDYGYFPELHTATADWSTNDVIGGIMPKMKGKDPTYEIQLGCVSKTVRNNWDKENPEKRILPTHENATFKGTWLVIDEFNRADIDKAMGQLFTALETRELKIPTSREGESFEQLTIPKDYRIIGTLNTADKHYLFKLSDALKRRFAYIEVPPPTKEQKEQEIFFALKNALNDLEHDGFESLITLDEDARKVDLENSNEDFVKAINTAYDILAYIRTVKSLGTAVLKSIYQTLLVGAKITEDFDRSLDSSINVNLIPQLENLQVSTLESVMEFLFGDPIVYFKEKQELGIINDKVANDFKGFLEYIEINKSGKKVESFKKNELNDDAWKSIQETYIKSKFELNLPMFVRSLRELVNTSSMI